MQIYGIDLKVYFLLFIIYAVIGWCMEVVCKLIQYKKFVDRGFLIGPYCPIYGVGALLITFFLNKYVQDPVVLFVMAVVVCGILEYLTSYFMEKIYHARWWDYSKKKFNINGRICLENLFLFGIASILIIYIINPFLTSKINNIPSNIQDIIIICLLMIHIVDNIVSYKIILNLKQVSNEIKDNTIEISEKVRNIIHNKSKFHRRLVDAFPNIKEKVQYTKWNIKDKIEKIRKNKED